MRSSSRGASVAAVVQPDEAHRPGVVRGRGGERLGDGGLDVFRRHRLGRELAHGPAQQLGLPAAELERFGGAQPEQVVVAGPNQMSRVAGRSHDSQRQSAHHGHRYGRSACP